MDRARDVRRHHLDQTFAILAERVGGWRVEVQDGDDRIAHDLANRVPFGLTKCD